MQLQLACVYAQMTLLLTSVEPQTHVLCLYGVQVVRRALGARHSIKDLLVQLLLLHQADRKVKSHQEVLRQCRSVAIV